MILCWRAGGGTFPEHSPGGNFSISYSFLDNYIETSGQRVLKEDLSHFSISYSFLNILLNYQYVTHFSITIYRPWVKGFERGICREVGQWGVSRGQSQSVGSLKESSQSIHINGLSKSPVSQFTSMVSQYPTSMVSQYQTSMVSQYQTSMVSRQNHSIMVV